MIDEISGDMAEQLKILRIAGILVADRQTIDAPGLTASPGGFVAVALMGYAVGRKSGLRIKELRVVSGIVRPDNDAQRGMNVTERDIPVFRISAGFAGPVQ